jgi:peptidoglycan/LPS O-acetylase OafA/YrhL
MILGVFLPLAQLPGFAVTVSLFQADAAYALLPIGIGVFAGLISLVRSKIARAVAHIVIGSCVALFLILVIIGMIGEYGSSSVQLIGIGYYCYLVGGVMLIYAGIKASREKSK